MSRYLLLCCFSFLIFGCGAQNVSFVTQTFKADSVSFSDITKNPIIFNGLDQSRIRSTNLTVNVQKPPLFIPVLGVDTLSDFALTFSDTIGKSLSPAQLANLHPLLDSLFDLDIYSLDRLCFNEFRQQLTARFPKITIIDGSKLPANGTAPFEMRVRKISISQRGDLSFDHVIQKVVVTVDIDLIDMRFDLVQFKLQSKGEVIRSVYSNPWNKAVQLAVARIVDYIKSNGKDHIQTKL
jgi:hypothetical protein